MAPDERPRRAAVVVNPTKVDDVGALRELVTTTMVGAGWVGPLWLETTADDPGYAMAQQALREGVALVLACGGDGTVRAVVTVLAGSGTPLALIPAGAGNLLARNLGLPIGDLEAALEVALTGDDRPIDVGRIEATTLGGRQERFAIMAGVGFDAAMVRDAPEQLKTRVGWPAYIVSGARNLRGSSMDVQVRIDGGEPIRVRARTVVIANVATLPGGMTLLPDARPDDGVLDVAIIISHSLMDWFRVWTRVVTHRANVDQRYTTHLGKQVRITMRSAQPCQMDGDLIEKSNQLMVEIEAAALLLRVPAGSRPRPRVVRLGERPGSPATDVDRAATCEGVTRAPRDGRLPWREHPLKGRCGRPGASRRRSRLGGSTGPLRRVVCERCRGGGGRTCAEWGSHRVCLSRDFGVGPV